MKLISNDKENSVVQLLSQNLSVRKVAMQAGVSTATVSRVMKKHALDHVEKPGRPLILSDTDKQKILQDITSGKCDTTKQVSTKLAQDMGITVSCTTICRVLKEGRLYTASKTKKPLLSKKHRQSRLDFANRHKDWTIADWQRIIWSDETKINRFGSDGRNWCWKSSRETLSNRTC